MGHHHRRHGDEPEHFNPQSYWRLIRYTFKYWKRLTIGLIAGFIFKKFKHIRNFKACRKGALIGFGVIAGVILLFLLLLLLAQI